MTAPRRHVSHPPLHCSPRASLDPTTTPAIDAALKRLKACSRRLQAALASHRTELQVLERLYYKGKNQHRTALFWQRVAETRRLGGRVDEMHMDDVIESLRLAFWGEPSSRTTKLLKGPWTHCPDARPLLFVMERCAACCALIDRGQVCLLRAYESFTLMMQTGAFLQLVLALAAIASRLSMLLSEVRAALEVSWSASYRALQALYPAEVGKAQRLANISVPAHTPPVAPSVPQSKSPAADTGPGEVQDEDLGSALTRPPQQAAEENVGAFDADASAVPLHHERPPDPVTFSLSNELARPTDSTAPRSTVGSSQVDLATSVANAPKRKKTGGESSRPVKKKKKKRDEIDDIFGF
ncbi:hypothetical protein BD413DRAFT_17917 [Trametes elegans]|nr:hypothetical protein BD413DRAFT_17917 [Trametes elegans]